MSKTKSIKSKSCLNCAFCREVKLLNATTFYCDIDKKYYPIVKAPKMACKGHKKGN